MEIIADTIASCFRETQAGGSNYSSIPNEYGSATYSHYSIIIVNFPKLTCLGIYISRRREIEVIDCAVYLF